MKKKLIKKIIPVSKVSEAPEMIDSIPTEKEILLGLYEDLKSRGINSIGDLENRIANAE